jgi:hypothetical protein
MTAPAVIDAVTVHFVDLIVSVGTPLLIVAGQIRQSQAEDPGAASVPFHLPSAPPLLGLSSRVQGPYPPATT